MNELEKLLLAVEQALAAGAPIEAINNIIRNHPRTEGIGTLDGLRDAVRGSQIEANLKRARGRERAGQRVGLIEQAGREAQNLILSGGLLTERGRGAMAAAGLGVARGLLDTAGRVGAGAANIAGAEGAAEKIAGETFERPLTQIEQRAPLTSAAGRGAGTLAPFFGLGLRGSAALAGVSAGGQPDFALVQGIENPLARSLIEGGLDLALSAVFLPIIADRNLGRPLRLDLDGVKPGAREVVLSKIQRGEDVIPGFIDEVNGVFLPTGNAHNFNMIKDPVRRRRIENRVFGDEVSPIGDPGGYYSVGPQGAEGGGRFLTREEAAEAADVFMGESSVVREAGDETGRRVPVSPEEARARLEAHAVDPDAVPETAPEIDEAAARRAFDRFDERQSNVSFEEVREILPEIMAESPSSSPLNQRVRADQRRRGVPEISDTQLAVAEAIDRVSRRKGMELRAIDQLRAAGIDPDAAARGVFESHTNFGGSTIDPRTGETLAGEDLWAVTAENIVEPRIQATPFTERDIKAFMSDPEVRAAMEADPSLRIGTASGTDTSTGSGHEINLTKTFESQDEAIQFGIENNQYSTLNLAHPEFRSAPLPTARAAAGAGPDRPPVTPGEAMAQQAIYRAELNRIVPERAARHREEFIGSLTPPERRAFERMEQTNPERAAEALEIASLMPDPREGASVALLGAEMQDWYRSSADALLRTFGRDDAIRFAGLLAATSPRTSVDNNVKGAIDIWTQWVEAGRPADPGFITGLVNANPDIFPSASRNNAITSLTSPLEELVSRRRLAAGPFAPQPGARGPRPASMSNRQGILSGQKVDPFYANLLDETILGAMSPRVRQRPVVDTHELAGAGSTARLDQPVLLGMSPFYRRTAEVVEELTGVPTTAVDVQAMRWGVIRALRRAPSRPGQSIEDLAAEFMGSETAAFGENVPTFNALRSRVADSPNIGTLIGEPENAQRLSAINVTPAPVIPTDPETLTKFDPSLIRDTDLLALGARLDRVGRREALFGLAAVAAGLGAAEGGEEGALAAGGLGLAAAIPAGRGWRRVADDALRLAGIGPDVRDALASSRIGLEGSLRFLHENPRPTPDQLTRFAQFAQIPDEVATKLARKLGTIDTPAAGGPLGSEDLRSVLRVENPETGAGPFMGPGSDQHALMAPTVMVPGPFEDFPEFFRDATNQFDPLTRAKLEGREMVFGFPDAPTLRTLSERQRADRSGLTAGGQDAEEARKAALLRALHGEPFGLFEMQVPRPEVLTGESGLQVMFPRPLVQSRRRIFGDEARELGLLQLGGGVTAAGLLSQRFREGTGG